MIEIKELHSKDWPLYSSRLQELESIAEYPYDLDSFRINHGASYFGFFERIGEPIFHVALEGDKVIASAAGILRQFVSAGKPQKAWYLCDLKVHPKYRKQGIPARLFRKRLFYNYLKCQKAYGISMNPVDQPNGVVGIAKRLPFFSIGKATDLNIYALGYDEMKNIKEELTSVVGPISYLSLTGKKDLIMKSTQQPMKLLHVQHGPFAEAQISDPQKDFVHMLCAPKASLLDRTLSAKFSPSATASVLAYGMSKVDWSFVLTSDI